MFALPRSSWADYDASLISAGGGVFPRTDKTIKLSKEIRAILGITADALEPTALITAILKAPADLLWFGGIGTYVKAASEANVAVGDPANDRMRVDAEDLRVTAIGEGANLGVTQAARIAFSLRGGRINTDFIDNSAGVDCSDNEVNIKIALNREMNEGRLPFDARNALLVEMTDDVAHLVLEDNRLQTLALSIAEQDGGAAIPSYVRVIEVFEETGRLDRAVEGLASNEELTRRGQEGRGLTRPELAVLLATAKLALQDAIEHGSLGADDALKPDLHAAFPTAMRDRYATAIDQHRLRAEIVATKLANRIVNRMGILYPFELAEEEGAAMVDIAAMFVVAERLFGLDALWAEIETAAMPEAARIALFDETAVAARSHIADLLRVSATGTAPGAVLDRLAKGIGALDRQIPVLLLDEARAPGRPDRGPPDRQGCARRSGAARRAAVRAGRCGGPGRAGRAAGDRRGGADARVHASGAGAGARLGAVHRRAPVAERSVGATADCRARARFPAIAAGFPRAAGRRGAAGGGGYVAGGERRHASHSSRR